MKAAILNGVIGLTLIILINLKIFHFSWFSLFLCILVANLAGIISLLLTLQIGRYAENTKKNWLRGSTRTWGFLSFFFISIILCFAPITRNPKSFIVLLIPLILSSSFSTLLFGLIQDRLIWKEQKKKKR